ncbi:MAG: thermonuclease family protein [Desulfomonile tiedjei]|uniref:Thermonuclease family protein n=1 Tax=Desulfomonile tiedjei TaxID=2358 RepID=A0A9D6UZY9_9BACT|nr:thermonuclease family protein [Desulfomonile tiedjei]
MSWNKGHLGVMVLALALLGICAPSWAFSPRYSLYGHARVLGVEAPNLVKLKMTDRERVLTARLIGVGSPRNKDRMKGLDPTLQSFISRHDIWAVSRNYVQTVLMNKTVEVWARKWDPYDDKNRLLVYIKIPLGTDEPVDVNAEIIRRGLGFVTRDYVHVTYVDYRYLEDDAKKNRRGMWKGLSMDRISSLDHGGKKWHNH